MTSLWEHEGRFYVTEGLLQISYNPKLQDEKDFLADPPVFVQPVLDWLAAHPEVRYVATPMVGPPWWDFPSEELRQEFMDRFLETPERLRELMDLKIAERKATRLKLWEEQGSRRDEKGWLIYTSPDDGRNYLLFPNEFAGAVKNDG